MCKSIVCAILCVFTSCVSLSLFAKTLEVDVNHSNCSDDIGRPFCGIAAAIGSAESNDSISIASGVYYETLVLDKNVKLTGFDYLNTVVNAIQESSVVTINPGVRAQISKITLQNGSSDNGGGVLNQGALMLNEVRIINNSARFSGGGIYNASSISGSLFIKNSIISHNYSKGDDELNIKYGGGGIFSDAPLFIEDSKLSHNNAIDNGGGLYTIFSGRSKHNDGQIVAEKLGISSSPQRLRSLKRKTDIGAVSIKRSYVSNNNAAAGGGINVHGVLDVSQSIINNNQAIKNSRSSGGGLFAHFDTSLNLTNVLFYSNLASNRGGGIRFYSVGFGKFNYVSIVNNHILENKGRGAGLYVIQSEDILELKNSLVTHNYTRSNNTNDCYGDFISAGNNFIGSVNNCNGFDNTIDITVK